MKNRLSIVASSFALLACLCLLAGFICISQNLAVTVAAASPQIALEIVEINHDSVKVSGTITNIDAVGSSGFEYRLISGSEILWKSKYVDPPALSFSTTIEELQSSSNYAVRAFYTVGLAIYYSDAQDFSTPEAPASPTVAPTTTPTPTLTPAPTPTTAPTTQTTQTTTSRETTEATTSQTTTQSQSTTTTNATDADNPGSSESTTVFLLIILSIIALALISIAVALFINIAKKSKT
ncbi:MAG: hypothetical protein SCM11_09715 [Bacillota bacterium]|nr:hypothetical protein [Bacillota bacterium]